MIYAVTTTFRDGGTMMTEIEANSEEDACDRVREWIEDGDSGDDDDDDVIIAIKAEPSHEPLANRLLI